MELDDFVDLAARMASVWRVALVTSSAVDIVLYTAVVAQTIRYFYTRSNDRTSAVVQRIVNTSGLEVRLNEERKRWFHPRPWDWLVFLVVAVATLKAGCSLATIVLLRHPVGERAWCDIVVSFVGLRFCPCVGKLTPEQPVYIAPFLVGSHNAEEHC